jgi:cyclic pyranopterin phosphate synthase
MPPGGVPLGDRHHILSFEEITRIVQVAAGLGISKVRLTGGEPLVRKNVTELVRKLKSIKGLEEVTLTTNGVMLSYLAWALKESGLDRINISLDTLDSQKYRQVTRGGDLNKVLEGIESTRQAGFKNTKLNMVLIPGFNDNSVDEMARFCREKGFRLQRINHYSLHDRVISRQDYEAERPMACGTCNRIRLTADGKLKPCLFSDLEYPVDLDDISSTLKKTVFVKPKKGRQCTVRGIWEIGG